MAVEEAEKTYIFEAFLLEYGKEEPGHGIIVVGHDEGCRGLSVGRLGRMSTSDWGMEGVEGRGEAVESQPTEGRKERENHHPAAEGSGQLNMKALLLSQGPRITPTEYYRRLWGAVWGSESLLDGMVCCVNVDEPWVRLSGGLYGCFNPPPPPLIEAIKNLLM